MERSETEGRRGGRMEIIIIIIIVTVLLRVYIYAFDYNHIELILHKHYIVVFNFF